MLFDTFCMVTIQKVARIDFLVHATAVHDNVHGPHTTVSSLDNGGCPHTCVRRLLPMPARDQRMDTTRLPCHRAAADVLATTRSAKRRSASQPTRPEICIDSV
jgi:hypothetical protein